MARREGHWVTREGDEIAICDMTTSHIINTMKMIERSTFNKLSGVISDRKVLIKCTELVISSDSAYKELEAELYKRDVTLGDVLICVTKKRRVISRGKS